MYDKFKEILGHGVNSVVISQVKKGVSLPYTKVQIAPFVKQGEVLFHITYVEPKRVTHENLSLGETVSLIIDKLNNEFNQMVVFGSDSDYHVTAFNGKIKIKASQSTKKVSSLSHDRRKNYLLCEDEGKDFWTALGIMGKNGEILKEKYGKFRQINKYLEFIRDVSESFPKNKTVKIVDFGCGKAYLTFALYYYLKIKLGIDVDIIGLDLKTDVVDHCEGLARRLGYDGLTFKTGDIGTFDSEQAFDLVISLHACDIATDEALLKGVLWKSRVILAVPCCQHELNPQLKGDDNMGLLRFGLMRERQATLLTDSARALLLEAVGYKCDLCEFIDMEHTPKNVLIKAVFTGQPVKKSYLQYQKLKENWGFTHHFEDILLKKVLQRESPEW